jgi:hypothetical protein
MIAKLADGSRYDHALFKQRGGKTPVAWSVKCMSVVGEESVGNNSNDGPICKSEIIWNSQGDVKSKIMIRILRHFSVTTLLLSVISLPCWQCFSRFVECGIIDQLK